ncbi:MAG: VOC family protein [Alphaproteobacteria bacterium]|nr:VOC family protein [Alphaproteobacteria bacterium]
MSHVTGIGGVFFRAHDPKAVVAWYKEHLDIEIGGMAFWSQEAGPTVFAPFKADTDYFGSSDQQWMINLRVKDLDGLLTKLKSKGIDVEMRDEWQSAEIGRFARIHDPAGTPIELWEPAEGCA